MEVCSVQWKTPFTSILCRPSQRGKTQFLLNLISVREQIFTPKVKGVFHFCKTFQDKYTAMHKLCPSLNFINSLPQSEKSITDMISGYKSSNVLLIFDDFQLEIEENIDFLLNCGQFLHIITT